MDVATFKRIIFKLILPLPNEIIVNSFELKSHLKKIKYKLSLYL